MIQFPNYTCLGTALETGFRDYVATHQLPEGASVAAHLNAKNQMSFVVYRFREKYESGRGNTLIEAIQAMERDHPQGAALIAKKREQAKALLSEAHQLEIQSQS